MVKTCLEEKLFRHWRYVQRPDQRRINLYPSGEVFSTIKARTGLRDAGYEKIHPFFELDLLIHQSYRGNMKESDSEEMALVSEIRNCKCLRHPFFTACHGGVAPSHGKESFPLIERQIYREIAR
jgi:hypothetical protein